MKTSNFRFLMAVIAGLGAMAIPCQAQSSRTAHLKWATTPPMGWNSWDAFATTVTEEKAKAQADYMTAHLKKFGWQYIVVDIQWYEPNADSFNYRPGAALTLEAWSRLQPAPNKFPSAVGGKGFKALADYIHSKGLKFGIHMMRGISRQAVNQNSPIEGTTARAADIADKTSTCPWNPDMYGVDMTKPGAQEYYDSIFKQAASWGLDFVKVDDLSRPYHTPEIEAIRKAIDKSGRAIVFSTSPGETPLSAADNVSQNANMWRMSDDFWDGWPALLSQFERTKNWAPYIGAGHFPDADMLPLGAVRQVPGYSGGPWTRFTKDEQVTMMTLWSMARSPLMMGGDMLKNDDWTLSLLTNNEVIGVDQKSANNHQLFNRGGQIGWIADVPGSADKYLGLFNTTDNNSIDSARAAFKSGLVTRDTSGHALDVDVDITGAKKLYLVVDDGGDNFNADHADWIEPRLTGPDGEKKLTDLQWASATTGWGQVSTTQSAGGKPMAVNGVPVPYGIGAHAQSLIEYNLPAGYTRFQAKGGLDDTGTSQTNMNGSTVHFLVFTQSPYAAQGSLSVPVTLQELGFTGAVKIRDLWKKQDIGRFTGQFAPEIPSHGAGLYRVSKAQ